MEYISENITAESPKKMSAGAKTIIALTGGVAIGLTVVCASFVAPAFRRYCLPYVPATTEQIQNVLSVVPRNAPGKLLDIGSGDGRIVFAAANHGIESHGVELNPWLVGYSKLAALKNRAAKPMKFFTRDLWKFDITPYNYIVIFGVEQMMKNLENKLIAEASPNCQIIACRFPLPNLEPIKVIEGGVNTVWLYNLQKK